MNRLFHNSDYIFEIKLIFRQEHYVPRTLGTNLACLVSVEHAWVTISCTKDNEYGLDREANRQPADAVPSLSGVGFLET